MMKTNSKLDGVKMRKTAAKMGKCFRCHFSLCSGKSSMFILEHIFTITGSIFKHLFCRIISLQVYHTVKNNWPEINILCHCKHNVCFMLSTTVPIYNL